MRPAQAQVSLELARDCNISGRIPESPARSSPFWNPISWVLLSNTSRSGRPPFCSRCPHPRSERRAGLG